TKSATRERRAVRNASVATLPKPRCSRLHERPATPVAPTLPRSGIGARWQRRRCHLAATRSARGRPTQNYVHRYFGDQGPRGRCVARGGEGKALPPGEEANVRSRRGGHPGAFNAGVFGREAENGRGEGKHWPFVPSLTAFVLSLTPFVPSLTAGRSPLVLSL